MKLAEPRRLVEPQARRQRLVLRPVAPPFAPPFAPPVLRLPRQQDATRLRQRQERRWPQLWPLVPRPRARRRLVPTRRTQRQQGLPQRVSQRPQPPPGVTAGALPEQVRWLERTGQAKSLQNSEAGRQARRIVEKARMNPCLRRRMRGHHPHPRSEQSRRRERTPPEPTVLTRQRGRGWLSRGGPSLVSPWPQLRVRESAKQKLEARGWPWVVCSSAALRISTRSLIESKSVVPGRGLRKKRRDCCRPLLPEVQK